jgi:hypothetical protein
MNMSFIYRFFNFCQAGVNKKPPEGGFAHTRCGYPKVLKNDPKAANHSIIRTIKSGSPSTWPLRTSPFLTAATPAGVPEKIKSPGSSANNVDK